MPRITYTLNTKDICQNIRQGALKLRFTSLCGNSLANIQFKDGVKESNKKKWRDTDKNLTELCKKSFGVGY